MKKKVLVVSPGWYPTHDFPVRGSYILEQINILRDDFDFKVVLGNCTQIGRKKAIKKVIQTKQFSLSERVDNRYIQDVPVYALDYNWIYPLSDSLEKYQYQQILNTFEKIYLELVESGWKPDLIHIQTLSGTAIYLADIAEKYKIPMVLTEHCDYPFQSDFWWKKKKELYARVDRVFCVSHDVLRHFLINYCTFKDFSIVGNYVKDDVISLKQNRKQKNHIAFVAFHSIIKDFGVLVDAIAELKLMLSDFKINIIGMFPDSGSGLELYQLVKEAKLESYFEFKGMLPREAIIQELSTNQILVSTSHCETFGLAVAEAILNGLPVVCTESGGIREFVNDTNGIVVPIREPKAVANAIVKVLDTIEEYDTKSMSEAIIAKYGKLAFSKRIKEEYTKVIEENE